MPLLRRAVTATGRLTSSEVCAWEEEGAGVGKASMQPIILARSLSGLAAAAAGNRRSSSKVVGGRIHSFIARGSIQLILNRLFQVFSIAGLSKSTLKTQSKILLMSN